jgi:hypothetical protein
MCLCCKTLFSLDARNQRHQKYCGARACRQASKRASQRQWLQKPANQDYFRGPANVERVRQWRKQNPHYWKRPEQGAGTLQELLNPQSPDMEEVRSESSQSTLQDLLTEQGPLLVGLISQLVDSPLQEHIEQTVRRLVSQGLSVLGMKPGTQPKGYYENQETGALRPAGATGPPAV